MPASRRASSKDVRRSLCLPTPLVKKRRVGTMFMPNWETLRRDCEMRRPTVIRVGAMRWNLSKLSQSYQRVVTRELRGRFSLNRGTRKAGEKAWAYDARFNRPHSLLFL